VEVVQQSVRSDLQGGEQHQLSRPRNAVYIEQHNKARRANSFVISGLPGSEQASDEQLIEALCV
jgi:hypothetical protein